MTITTAQDATTYLTDLLAEANESGATLSELHAAHRPTGLNVLVGDVATTLDRIARHAAFPDWASPEVMTKAVRQEVRRTFRRYLLPKDLYRAAEVYALRAA